MVKKNTNNSKKKPVVAKKLKENIEHKNLKRGILNEFSYSDILNFLLESVNNEIESYDYEIAHEKGAMKSNLHYDYRQECLRSIKAFQKEKVKYQNVAKQIKSLIKLMDKLYERQL